MSEADHARSKRLRELAGEAASLLPPEDRLKLDDLSAEVRAEALKRLAVVHAWRSDERTALFENAADAARHVGLTRRAFFHLLSRMDPPSISGLGLNVDRRIWRSSGTVGRRAKMVDLATDLLRERPAAKTSEVVQAIAEDVGLGVSKSTMLRTAVELRREHRRSGTFGRLLALDAASLDGVDFEGIRQRLYAIVDVDTGLIPAWHVAPDRLFGPAYATMAERCRAGKEDSMSSVALRGLAVVDVELRERECSLPRDTDYDFLKGLAAAEWTLALNPRRIGSRVIEALGRDVAGFGLGAGFAPPDVFHRSRVPTSLPVLTEVSVARIRIAVADHNAARLHAAARGAGDALAIVREAVDVVANLSLVLAPNL
jgi:hypothetical protein